jgi:hypothetical protein
MPELTDATFSIILGSLILFGLLLGYPALITALALLRSRRVLGKLSPHVTMAVDAAKAAKSQQSQDGRESGQTE